MADKEKNGYDDDEPEVVGDAASQKLEELKASLPFINKVMEMWRIKPNAYHKLSMLKEVLGRNRVSMQTLGKIEGVISRLKVQFGPEISVTTENVRHDSSRRSRSSDVIDISDGDSDCSSSPSKLTSEKSRVAFTAGQKGSNVKESKIIDLVVKSSEPTQNVIQSPQSKFKEQSYPRPDSANGHPNVPNIHTESSKLVPSLEEARKKLAALRNNKITAVTQILPSLASNSNDPRGRNLNYTGLAATISGHLSTENNNNMDSISAYVTGPFATHTPVCQSNASPPAPGPVPPPPSIKSLNLCFTRWPAQTEHENNVTIPCIGLEKGPNARQTVPYCDNKALNNNPRVCATSASSGPPPHPVKFAPNSGVNSMHHLKGSSAVCQLDASNADEHHSINGTQRTMDKSDLESRQFTGSAMNACESRDPRRKLFNSKHQQQKQRCDQYLSDSFSLYGPAKNSNANTPALMKANLPTCWRKNGSRNNSSYDHINSTTWSNSNNKTGSNVPHKGSYRSCTRGGRNTDVAHSSRYQMPPIVNEPRTYREHKEAKARAEATAALAKVPDRRQQTKIPLKEVESVEPTIRQVPEVQLDTSYRTVVLDAPPKKLDFKIPKRSDIARSKCNDKHISIDYSKNESNKSDQSKEKQKKAKTDTEEKQSLKKQSGKVPITEAKSAKKASNSTKDKTNELPLKDCPQLSQKEFTGDRTKVNTETEHNNDKLSLSGDIYVRDAELINIIQYVAKKTKPLRNSPQNSTTDEITSKQHEFAQPSPKGHHQLVCTTPEKFQDRLTEVIHKSPKEKTGNNSKGPDDVCRAESNTGTVELQQKICKLKIVLGGNARTVVLPHASPFTDSQSDNNKMQLLKNSNISALLEPKLQRIKKRRSTLAPTSSEPLIDKQKLFATNSLVYEDLQQEKQKHSRINRSLVNMFEKTDDNCSVSTQNIIIGKRRTRVTENTLNEVELGRSVFKHIKPNAAKAGPKPKDLTVSETAVKRKRGRPAKQVLISTVTANEVEIDELPAAKRARAPKNDKELSSSEPVPTIPPAKSTPSKVRRRPKRNELDKLNEDIASMYYAEDVIRATGRRACTQVQYTLSSIDVSSETSNTYEAAPLARNMARRGRPMGSLAAAGPNRATLNAMRFPLTRKCRVRVKRCPLLQFMENKIKPNIKNDQVAWHAKSEALKTCVVCVKNVKAASTHYVQYHGEHYGARLPPGVLQELLESRRNRPLYIIGFRYYHTCPFCDKTLCISNSSWVEHFARHTGEANYQCSRCSFPQHRASLIEKHVSGCGSGAKMVVNNYYNVEIPVRAFACHLCEFIQLNQENVSRHYLHHHDLEVVDIADNIINITLYRTEGVPYMASESEAAFMDKKGKAEEKQKKNSDKIKLEKMYVQVNEQSSEEADEFPVVSEPVEEMDCTVVDEPASQLEEEQHDICNEVKLELTVPLLELDLALETESEHLADGKINKHLNKWPSPLDSLALNTLSRAIQDDNLSGIGSDESESEPFEDTCLTADIMQTVGVVPPDELVNVEAVGTAMVSKEAIGTETVGKTTVGKKAVGKEAVGKEAVGKEAVGKEAVGKEAVGKEAVGKEMIGKETDVVITPRKSLFQKFNRLISKLKTKSTGYKQRRSKDTVSMCSDSDTPFESDASVLDPIPQSQPKPKATVPGTLTPSTNIENVAYRLLVPKTQQYSYYCIFPGCDFLFSDELEGLQVHFSHDHPKVRWSGHCAACGKQVEPAQNYELSLELQHMVQVHVYGSVAAIPATETEQVPLPKLRVRRFTGDRLLESEEPQNFKIGLEEPECNNKNGNTILRDLLKADARLPKQQPDLNAAGLGEFLCPKSAPMAQSILESTLNSTSVELQLNNSEPIVVNHTTELGLAIDKVYSLDPRMANALGFEDPSEPLITSETVPLPSATNGEYVLTQTLSQQYGTHNQTEPHSAHINISIASTQPEANKSMSIVSNHTPCLIKQPTASVADQFRCMAPNCGFCACTSFYIRQHMEFHRISNFGSNTDYLRCAYCAYMATDVDSYIEHGNREHGLDSESRVDENVDALNKKIREKLSSRHRSIEQRVLSEVSCEAMSAATSTKTPTSCNVPLSIVIREILATTGLKESKLFACPQKNCNTTLSKETFVNHVMFHLSSSGAGLSMEGIHCKHCKHRVSSDRASQMVNHLHQAHLQHRYFCGICIATASNGRLMQYHIRTVHSQNFQLVNRQIQFVQLPGIANNSSKSDEKYWVCALEHPFGKKQIDNFTNMLINEWQQRKQGSKLIYWPSELRVLPRQKVFSREVQCGECKYKTNSRSVFQNHLQSHLDRAMQMAYESECDDRCEEVDGVHLELSGGEDGTGKTLVVENISFENGIDAQAMQSEIPKHTKESELPTNSFSGDPSLSKLVLTQTSQVLPGRQTAVNPRYKYVPKEKRYICGVRNCQKLLSTEYGLRQHLTMHHRYSELYFCCHCNENRRCVLNVDNILQHLQLHKQHLYQCGACTRFHSKCAQIKTHINEKHGGEDVDIIVHKRTHALSSLGEVRWLKPFKTVHSKFKWACNLCNCLCPSQNQIAEHARSAHNQYRQYICPHCGFNSCIGVDVIKHLRATHPNERVEPIQNYRFIKEKLTVGFYCNFCDATAKTYQRMTAHCEKSHNCKYQYKCAHCPYGNPLERSVIGHTLKEHSLEQGVAVQQFQRVQNDLPDSELWKEARPIKHVNILLEKIQQETETHCDEEADAMEIISSAEEEEANFEDITPTNDKLVLSMEFACSYCNETNRSITELRQQHWVQRHPDQPFYFSVQPQLKCAQCHDFVGNAKAMLDHLLRMHQIRNLMACDTRRNNECAFCEYKYQSCYDLMHHILKTGHLSNDLKYMSDYELNSILNIGNEGAQNEYFQCNICYIIMPTQVAMARHGSVEHIEDKFCFRPITQDIIYHCSFCMFASTEEQTTLKHMLEHYRKFRTCHFCNSKQDGGFEEYIQHCYSLHNTDVHKFPDVHTFSDLKKFLMQVLYQFRTGLVISKSSLRQTRYNSEYVMRQLYDDLIRKSQQPPLPRLKITKTRNPTTSGVTVLTETAATRQATTAPAVKTCYESTPSSISNQLSKPETCNRQASPTGSIQTYPDAPARITKRRNTYNINAANLSMACGSKRICTLDQFNASCKK
ncbi:uncharacterized protein LOC115629894 isoform X2 [Scaptodrosophila lebanonensis]|uniref:Uncharacterized protein LOC115629894 isoform X2 n=1 Tax=Drosophila lebanonensis TaxID=7225 RepID=A0A6J2U5D2_DROLE|nr:uncharacterized protein LOC115629894 isoform X2 [Scaptodrosophila lebanonensis]